MPNKEEAPAEYLIHRFATTLIESGLAVLNLIKLRNEQHLEEKDLWPEIYKIMDTVDGDRQDFIDDTG